MHQKKSDRALRRRLKRIYPWIAITVSALFLFYKYILQVSPSIMTNDLMRVFHVQGAGLGNLAANFFYSYMVTQLFVGVLLDKYSARYLSAIAITIAACGAYLFAKSDTLLMASISRMMMGVGAAFATVSYMKVAAMWFKPKQFAFVGGLLATAAMLGAIFGEAPLALVVDSEGWRQSLFLVSVLGFIIAILFVVVIRDKHTSEAFDQHGPSAGITMKDVWHVLSKKQNWILTFYSGLAFSPVAVFGGLWGNPFLQEAHHLSLSSTATLTSLIFAGLAIGGPILGFVSDVIRSRKKVMLFGTTLSFICMTVIIYFPEIPIWLLVLLLFLFGFGTGSFMLGFAVGKEINSVSLAATVIALINTGDAIFGAYTEPLIGKFLDMEWTGITVHGAHYFRVYDYQRAFLLLPLYLLVASILVFFIKETFKKRKRPMPEDIESL